MGLLTSILPVFASAGSIIQDSANNACADACNTTLTASGLIATIANVLVFLVGSISTIMIIVGGIRYALSQGDPGQAAKAKNTILYAVFGVVAAIAAYAIIQFVTTTFNKAS